jgi:DNA-binding MarR family transcriptional regulator
MAYETIRWAMKQEHLKSTAQLVLVKLANYRNQKTGQCNPSQTTLARACSKSVSTINKHLRDLEDQKLIRRVRRFDKDTRAACSTQYEFPSADLVDRCQDDAGS